MKIFILSLLFIRELAFVRPLHVQEKVASTPVTPGQRDAEIKDRRGQLDLIAHGCLASAEYRRDSSNRSFFLTDTENAFVPAQTPAELGLLYWWERSRVRGR